MRMDAVVPDGVVFKGRLKLDYNKCVNEIGSTIERLKGKNITAQLFKFYSVSR